MADEAVLDAPVLDAGLDTDQQVDIQTDADATVDTTQDKAADQSTEVKGDGRKLPAEIRALKETDPVAYKQQKAEFFSDLAYKETLGKEAEQIRAFLDEKGGLDGISQTIADLQGKAQELDSISQALTEGRAEDVLKLVPAESYSSIGPAVAQKWAEADPEGWGRAMSGIMASTIQSSGVPMFLERIGMLLEFGKTEEAQQALQKLGEWAGSFQKQATAPVAPKQPTNAPDVNAERQQWEQEKFTKTLTEEVESARSQMIEGQLKTYIARDPKDADKKALAISETRRGVIERLTKDADFQKNLNALVARRDKDGAMRLIKSREQKAIEEIAPKVGRTIFGQPAAAVTPKPAAVPNVRKSAPVPTGDPRDAVLARILAR